jgi:hypothetical protein
MRWILALILVAWSSASFAKVPNACERLAEAFFLLASNKDTGATIESQKEMIGEDTAPESRQYLLGILKIVYSKPKSDAEEIKSEFLGSCMEDEEGQIQLPVNWDPWQQNT